MGSFLQHGVVWYRDQASEATGCRPNHSLRPSPWVTLAFTEKKQMAACIYQPGYNECEESVVFSSLWLCSRLSSEHNRKMFYTQEWCKFVGLPKDYISQRSLRVCKHHWVTVLKALEETPMLSRAAQKGVSTWVVRQLSHVITALAVSVTPIT